MYSDLANRALDARAEFQLYLLPQTPLFEEISPQHMQVHGRLLLFLLEEFISLGVVEVTVRDSWRYKKEIDELPLAFRNRIVISETKKPEQIAISYSNHFSKNSDYRRAQGPLSTFVPQRMKIRPL